MMNTTQKMWRKSTNNTLATPPYQSNFGFSKKNSRLSKKENNLLKRNIQNRIPYIFKIRGYKQARGHRALYETSLAAPFGITLERKEEKKKTEGKQRKYFTEPRSGCGVSGGAAA
jgi:hypothetical protein